MLVRILAVATALCLTAALYFGWRLDNTSNQLKVALEANTTLAAQVVEQQKLRDVEQDLAQKYYQKNKLLQKQQKETKDALAKALAENADWAAQRVPAGVSDALGVR